MHGTSKNESQLAVCVIPFCAFLNRHCGTILLGVQDSGEVTGIDPDTVTQIKKDFVTAINNPQYGQVRTENSNKPHGLGVLNPTTFTPFPKNPVIGAFFREIHRADELGSGMRKMMRYGKAYGGADPEMIEGDVFRIIVKVPEFQQIKGSEPQSGQLAPE
ncbi:MAG: putative DNA binding domain-containing protein, partial [Candidatus Desulfaltia sp.]|nr:putative DNA binding domain-containing protein [Candidatus Desulfaltia sp.]